MRRRACRNYFYFAKNTIFTGGNFFRNIVLALYTFVVLHGLFRCNFLRHSMFVIPRTLHNCVKIKTALGQGSCNNFQHSLRSQIEQGNQDFALFMASCGRSINWFVRWSHMHWIPCIYCKPICENMCRLLWVPRTEIWDLGTHTTIKRSIKKFGLVQYGSQCACYVSGILIEVLVNLPYFMRLSAHHKTDPYS